MEWNTTTERVNWHLYLFKGNHENTVTTNIRLCLNGGSSLFRYFMQSSEYWSTQFFSERKLSVMVCVVYCCNNRNLALQVLPPESASGKKKMKRERNRNKTRWNSRLLIAFSNNRWRWKKGKNEERKTQCPRKQVGEWLKTRKRIVCQFSWCSLFEASRDGALSPWTIIHELYRSFRPMGIQERGKELKFQRKVLYPFCLLKPVYSSKYTADK